MRRPWVGLSFMVEPGFLAATLELFENAEVEVLEWSPDIGWSKSALPNWAESLLTQYGDEKRLLGHGVNFSPLTAGWTDTDRSWLKALERELEKRTFTNFSEHFGFSRSGQYVQGAPLPVPYTRNAVRIGQDKLARLAELVGGPIGLENLALAFCKHDVELQGSFLEELLAPLDGFLVLDLHNLYCQSVNFSIAPERLMHFYPLDRVKEIHISGGSWSMPDDAQHPQPIRRDTHDNPVPNEVFALLALALAKCRNVDAVILERLGNTLDSPEQQEKFRAEFRRMREITNASRHLSRSNLQMNSLFPAKVVPDELDILDYQTHLMQLLNSSVSAAQVINTIVDQHYSNEITDYVRSFEPRMIEVGKELVVKWSQKI